MCFVAGDAVAMGVGTTAHVMPGDPSQAHHTVPQLLRRNQGGRKMDTEVSVIIVTK